MKSDLIKHIEEIFNSLRLTVSFEVFDCCLDTLPKWTKDIQLTHKFIVCCHDISLKQRLQVFIGKAIFENGKYLYWFEGERIIEPDSSSVKEKYKIEDEKIEYLKTDTRLPAYIDDFIFNQLKAIYAPDFQRFEYNLDLTGEEIRKYLGTYFPRSYAESFCIFDNLFENNGYQKATAASKNLNILSVGCGTGGDIIGLITAIQKHLQNVSEVTIFAIDGNNETLTILEQIINRIKNQSSKKINLITIQIVFSNIAEFQIVNDIKQSFDFILSFKFINEIVSMGKGRLVNSYYDFVKKFLPLLSDNGVCLLLDVTTKSNHATYNPILMNSQVNQALRELKRYSTLIPIQCGVHSGDCFCDCFHQKTFFVTHSKQSNDKSKVAYRMIVSQQLQQEIINSTVKKSRQLINKENICPFTENGEMTVDAFMLSPYNQNVIL
ncbi:MAG: hypothetical protein IPM52_02430 [Bacteroidetes bacterium]|nr:hypothetical protein [Bacteroidota bacterium]